MKDFFIVAVFSMLAINYIIAFFIVFFERKNPAVIWAWLIILSIIPGIGFMLYIVFGFDGRRHSQFLLKFKSDEKILEKYLNSNSENIKEQIKYLSQENILKYSNTDHLDDIVRLNIISSNSPFRKNNSLEMFFNGREKFDKLMQDISNAKKFIHIQYYIIRDDVLGNKILKLISEKARQGIEIKFLYDGMGNLFNSKRMFNELISSGGSVGVFLPPHFIRINYRNHRKICIIDGKTGYIGGFNIGDEYISGGKKFSHWQDIHIRVEGNAVNDLELRFISDWNFTSKQKIKEFEKYFTPQNNIKGDVNMQILSSGADCKWNTIHQAYFKLITEANRSICIETPYFVPDDSISQALKISALSGIDVKIIIPANPDHPFVYSASLSYIGELLKCGVKFYKYEKGFLHSKLIIMDNIITSVGTANMDIRSFKLNFETNAIIYDKSVTEKFMSQFETDLKNSTQITENWYNSRSKASRIKEAFAHLISPML